MTREEDLPPRKYGTMLLFGAKPPHKADPRFPCPITLAGDDCEPVDYISREECSSLLRASEERAERLKGNLRLLEEFAQHTIHCAKMDVSRVGDPEKPCTCGMDKAFAEIVALEGAALDSAGSGRGE